MTPKIMVMKVQKSHALIVTSIKTGMCHHSNKESRAKIAWDKRQITFAISEKFKMFSYADTAARDSPRTAKPVIFNIDHYVVF